MNTTLCRCMTYYRVQAAIKRAAKTIADAEPSSAKEILA
jgi:aerobic-type carbon monoxide dehydrogenase small subunit (CoxS/CutS family)